ENAKGIKITVKGDSRSDRSSYHDYQYKPVDVRDRRWNNKLYFAPIPRREMNRNENLDRKSTRLNSSHVSISYAVFCLKKKRVTQTRGRWRRRTVAQTAPPTSSVHRPRKFYTARNITEHIWYHRTWASPGTEGTLVRVRLVCVWIVCVRPTHLTPLSAVLLTCAIPLPASFTRGLLVGW